MCLRFSSRLTHLFHSFVLQIQVGNRNWRSPTDSHRFLRSDTGCCCRNVFWQSILGVQENNWSLCLTYPPSLYHQSSKDSMGSRLFTADTMILSHWLPSCCAHYSQCYSLFSCSSSQTVNTVWLQNTLRFTRTRKGSSLAANQQVRSLHTWQSAVVSDEAGHVYVLVVNTQVLHAAHELPVTNRKIFWKFGDSSEEQGAGQV